MSNRKQSPNIVSISFESLRQAITELRQYITKQSLEIAQKNIRIAELEKQLEEKK